MSVTPFFRWYDLWIGFYWDRFERVLYFCPLPMVGLKIGPFGPTDTMPSILDRGLPADWPSRLRRR